MSTNPPRGGLEPTSVPVLTGRTDAVTDGLTPADWFVLSRVDGRASVHVIGQLVGMSDAAAAEVLERLARAGHVKAPGFEPGGVVGAPTEAPASNAAPAAERAATAEEPRGSSPVSTGPSTVRSDVARGRTPGGMPRNTSMTKSGPARGGLTLELVDRAWPVRFAEFTFDPDEMRTGTALTDEQKQVVLYFHYHLRRVSYYDLFAVSQDAQKNDIRKSYFRLSKAFHPDRWFRKDVGVFGDRIETVFKWVNRAYAVLNSPRKRKGYDRLLSRGYVGEWQLEDRDAAPTAAQNQPPVDARGATAMLRIKARRAESDGAWRSAGDLYHRALQIEPSPELRIRYIECMLKAGGEPDELEAAIVEGRNRGESGVRLQILEAEVARRLGDVSRSRACYEQVLSVEPSNPVARLGLDRLNEA